MTALDVPPTGQRTPLARGRGDGIGRLARRTQRGQGGRRMLVVALVAPAVALGVVSGAFTATMVETDTEGVLLDRLGPADLLLEDQHRIDVHANPVLTPEQQAWIDGRGGADPEALGGEPVVAATVDDVVDQLPAGSDVLRYVHDGLHGYRDGSPVVTDLDVTHPLAGRSLDTGGRAEPLTGDEALASPSWLARHDTAVGDTLEVDGVGEVEVVGTATRAVSRSQPLLVVAPGRELDLPNLSTALRVDLPADARTDVVASQLDERIEQRGAAATANTADGWPLVPDVLTAAEIRGGNTDPVAVSTLVGTVVTGFAVTVAALLAACAFAVGVRRRLRELGMLGAVGASPQQLGRLVRREALVIGVVGAVLGAVLGIVLSIAARPLVERLVDSDVVLRLPPMAVLPPVLLGALGAMLAAWWPARTAARVPVVAALAGRVPTGRLPGWLPVASGCAAVVGVLLFALSWSIDGSHGGVSGRGLPVLGASIVATLGTAGLGLPVLAFGGRVADRLPVRARLAVRDAARRRTRSGAAVAALVPVLALPVAAVVLGTADAGDPGGAGYVWVDPAPSPHVTVFGPSLGTLIVPPREATVDAVAAALPADGRRADVVLVGRDGPGSGTFVAWPAPADDPAAVEPEPGPSPGPGPGRGAYVEAPSAPLALATPELLDLLGLPADTVEDGEVLVLRRGLRTVPPRDGQEVVVTDEPFVDPGRLGAGPAADPDLARLAAVVRDDVDAVPSAAVLVTPATAEQLGLREVGRPVALGLERPPTRGERDALWPLTGDTGGFVDTAAVVPFWDTPAGRLVLAGVVALVVLMIVTVVAGMTAALAATESDDDLRRAVALGAPPSLRRVFHGIQAWWHAAIAGVLGSMLGAVVGLVALDQSGWQSPDPRVWPLVAAWALLAPVVIGAVITLCMRSSPVEAPRRRAA